MYDLYRTQLLTLTQDRNIYRRFHKVQRMRSHTSDFTQESKVGIYAFSIVEQIPKWETDKIDLFNVDGAYVQHSNCSNIHY